MRSEATPREGPTAGFPPQRVDRSMSLLVDMMANTLDEAYADRAALRDRAPRDPAPAAVRRRRGHRVVPLLGLVALGALTGTAIDQVRDRQVADSGLRSGLAQEVRERTADTDRLAARAAALRDEVVAVREQALGADAAGQEAARRLTRLGAASATTPVQGPGIVVTVDDAPTGDGAGTAPLAAGAAPDGRVTDRDLQDVVNGLWAAGAEAIAVNDQRLTVRTAIRSAGAAVLVDLRPLNPPYVVEAIGPASRLEVRFVDGPGGRLLTALSSLHGVVFQVERAEELTLPGGSATDLLQASPVPEGGS